ncbi:hypothetical protein PoB_006088300 [Plakobranchus ocellatus]|uniref:Uncharacterized protein n=1 Tax=Plakobranchus ocellatus TaxID=259542 RepID=A0AAV4CR41_9GAST|nr:hypothetical protein PoB_006088300 [Plakobranchus ocellatus]
MANYLRRPYAKNNPKPTPGPTVFISSIGSRNDSSNRESQSNRARYAYYWNMCSKPSGGKETLVEESLALRIVLFGLNYLLGWDDTDDDDDEEEEEQEEEMEKKEGRRRRRRRRGG